MSRITSDTASILVGRGIPATVLFPAVDWWEYKRFMILRLKGIRRGKWLSRLAIETMIRILVRRRWCGFKYYNADPRIRAVRYWVAPSATGWREDEITVVHPPYLIPDLLRTIPNSRIKVVSALHMNLEKAIRSPSGETAAWYRHWVARDRMISVPRYTTSVAAKEAAERLGIPIRRVIYDGSIDLRVFRPGRPRPQNGSLMISVYCDPNPQKGQAIGVEVCKALKSVVGNVHVCSIGRVCPKYAKAFDRNYGFLHGDAFVKALQDSDVFVYPSLYDAFPAPPLQAMACGAALVTSAVEGVTEYAVHGENALVCEPGNVEMMCDEIVRVVHDRELRGKLQANGPRTAAAFNLERSATQLLEFLQEVYDEKEAEMACTVEA